MGNEMKRKLIILFAITLVFFSQVAICQAQIDAQKKYDIIYGSLKDLHSEYIIDVMKTIALLTIGLGWLVTSDKSREFFKKNRTARISSIIIIALLCIINYSA
jgi:hypothetical protein